MFFYLILFHCSVSRDVDAQAEDDWIQFQFVAHVSCDPNFVGRTYYIGAAVGVNSDELWAAPVEVEVVAHSSKTMVGIACHGIFDYIKHFP